jgi:hypothetical protein
MGIGVIVQIIITVASTAYQINKQKKMKAAAAAEADKRKGFAITTSGEATSLPICYGKNVLGGIATKHKVTNGYYSATDTSDKTFSENFSTLTANGNKNEFLHVQYALSTEGIEGVQWVKVNGSHYNAPDPKFQHIIRTFSNGGTADPIATANGIPSTNTFTGTSFASATYRLNRDDQNYSGVPTIEFLIKGQKVHWVEESGGVYSLSSTKTYSNNPALCLLDYLLDTVDGRGIPADNVDLKSFYDSANVCDIIVATDRLVAGKVNGQKSVTTVADNGSRPTNLPEVTFENELWYTTDSGKYWYWNKTTWVETTLTATRPIPLYECNLVLDTNSTVRDNIEKILDCMGLAELTWTSEGKYKLLLEHPTTGSELVALVDSSHFFTDDDIIRDDISISWASANERLNQATVTFSNEHEDFKDDTVTWPETYSTVHNQYLTEDNNQPFQATMAPPGVTDPYHALAMAEQAVRKARTMFVVEITVSKKGLNLEPGDFVSIDSDVANISNEIFRVEEVSINSDFSCKLKLYKFDHEVLAWNIDDDIAYATPPTFDFTLAAPTALTFTAGSAEILGTSPGKLSWVASDDIAVTKYLVEVSADNGVTYKNLGTTRNTTFDVVGLQTGVYKFSVRGYSESGVLSDRLVSSNQTIQLQTVGRVAIIYGDTIDETTNTQSYTLGSNEFVAYYSYEGDLPTLPIRTGITFAGFIGADGAIGVDGDRGAGWWRYETGTTAAVTGLSETAINNFFSAAVGLAVTPGDRFIIVNSNDDAVGYLRNSANTAWVQQADFLDGDLLVNGTITATKLVSDELSTLGMTIGTLSSAASGQRTVIKDDGIIVYDSSGTVRVKLGNLS